MVPSLALSTPAPAVGTLVVSSGGHVFTHDASHALDLPWVSFLLRYNVSPLASTRIFPSEVVPTSTTVADVVVVFVVVVVTFEVDVVVEGLAAVVVAADVSLLPAVLGDVTIAWV